MKLLLEGVIYQHREDRTPEQMRQPYPDLDIGIAMKIIDYYAHNRESVDEYVAQTERDYEKARLETEARQASMGIEPLRVIRQRRRAQRASRANESSSDAFEKVAT
jgi:hypothetical protein